MMFNVGELLTVGLARTETLLGLALLAFSVGGLIIFPQPELRLIFIHYGVLAEYLLPLRRWPCWRNGISGPAGLAQAVTSRVSLREFHTRKLLKPGSRHLVEVNKVIWGA